MNVQPAHKNNSLGGQSLIIKIFFKGMIPTNLTGTNARVTNGRFHCITSFSFPAHCGLVFMKTDTDAKLLKYGPCQLNVALQKCGIQFKFLRDRS